MVDIGGGSTEFIIGQRFEPLLRESLQMGCVSYTQRYFRDEKITPGRYAQAYTAARLELMGIEHALHRLSWQSDRRVRHRTRHWFGDQRGRAGQRRGQQRRTGLLKRKILKLGEVEKLTLDGINLDRRGIVSRTKDHGGSF